MYFFIIVYFYIYFYIYLFINFYYLYILLYKEPNISTFIKKVRYFLHPSYKPNIVDVTDPPFHLTRYGWGEFPIRVQLFFEDIVNKPIDIIHILKV